MYCPLSEARAPARVFVFLELLKDLVPSPASRHDIRGGNETVDTRPVDWSGLSCGWEGFPGGPLSFSLTRLHFLLPRSSSLHSMHQCEHMIGEAGRVGVRRSSGYRARHSDSPLPCPRVP